MSNIIIKNLTFELGDNLLFNNVNLTIDAHWKLGLIGRNGRGKTTLLKLICGAYDNNGSISSPLSFEYFPYQIADTAPLSVDVLETIAPDMELWKVIREMSLLELPTEVLYQPYNTLSSGQQTKLQLALMFSKDSRFLLIDEPTNHLDTLGRRCVSEYLSTKQGFIVVSHDRNFLDTCIDHVMSINKSNIDVQKGNYSSWKSAFDAANQAELEQNKNLKKEIAKLNKSAMQKQQWSNTIEKSKTGTRIAGLRPDRGYMGHMSAKMAKKAKVVLAHVDKKIEDKKKLLKNVETTPNILISPENPTSKRFICAKGLSLSFNDKNVLNGLNFSLDFGDRIAITGKNGCGKSSLLRVINGDLSPSCGQIIKSPSLTISYLPQDASSLSGKLDDYIDKTGCDNTLFKTILRKLGFNRNTFSIPLENYSQGQKKKVTLTASLCTKAHLYLWDEPLNYIDIMSRIQIENIILSSNCTMIIVEHDNTFLQKVATKFIDLEQYK